MNQKIDQESPTKNTASLIRHKTVGSVCIYICLGNQTSDYFYNILPSYLNEMFLCRNGFVQTEYLRFWVIKTVSQSLQVTAATILYCRKRSTRRMEMPKYEVRRDGFIVISCCARIIFSTIYEAASMAGKKNTLRFLVLITAYTACIVSTIRIMPKFLISQLVTHLNQSAKNAVKKVRQEMARSLDSLWSRT